MGAGATIQLSPKKKQCPGNKPLFVRGRRPVVRIDVGKFGRGAGVAGWVIKETPVFSPAEFSPNKFLTETRDGLILVALAGRRERLPSALADLEGERIRGARGQSDDCKR
jgi:hypothetical protein